tara:strand:- start:130245 stop:131096 length:852 start_codon:yes stop_codon:yes gene_type:complete
MDSDFLKDNELIANQLKEFADKAMDYAPKLALAIISLLLGLWFISLLGRSFGKLLSKRNVDPSLGHFLVSLSTITLKIALAIAVIEMVGIKTTSFVAVLGAAGLAVGLALQGSLSNFAGGVLILLFRPFKTGDYILAQGEEGTVQKIDIFNTWVNKLDNRRVILPNGPLASGVIVNVTAEDVRRVDIPIGISYTSNIDKTREVLLNLAKEDERILPDPTPIVKMVAMADSSVNFTFRVWVKTPDYWEVFWDLTEKAKKAFDKNGIEIPFPQRDVHLYNHQPKA